MSLRFIVRRLGTSVLVLFLVAVVAFSLIYIVPGDPARILLGPRASPENVEALRVSMGFYRPILTQFFEFISGIFQGDFGTSLAAKRPSVDLVMEALPATLLLASSALIVAFGVGVPMGIMAALQKGKAFDRFALGLAIIGQSVPAFWLGLVLIAVVALRMGLLPTSGYGSFKHLILPTLCLAPYILGVIIRITRISVLEVLDQDYMRTAKSKGLSQWNVVGKHAFKNALIPIVTIMGFQIAALLGGAVITETVFAWPGIGQLAVNSISSRDWPVVRTIILFSAIGLVVINFFVDVTYSQIDKRIRFK